MNGLNFENLNKEKRYEVAYENGAWVVYECTIEEEILIESEED